MRVEITMRMQELLWYFTVVHNLHIYSVISFAYQIPDGNQGK